MCLCPGFMCDSGKNIHVGNQFLANYNVTILDIMPVYIGDYVMIGPNTLITTVNHPITPKGRREHLGIGKPVTIGNDVPDNCVIGGVPAKKIRDIENDIL